MKYIFITFSLLLFIYFNSIACTSRTPIVPTFDDTLHSFYVSQAGDTLVVAGDTYHYVFKHASANVREFFQSKRLLDLKAANLDFQITTNNTKNLSLNMSVHFSSNTLTPEQISWIESHGFHGASSDSDSTIEYMRVYFLGGEMYHADASINQKLVKLAAPMAIRVDEIDKNDAVQIEMTPLVTEDSVVTLGTTILDTLIRD